MIFKTIDDNDSLSGQRIVSKFTARKIAQEEATKQLEIDIQCLRNYEAECQKGSVSTETFNNTMKGASVEAQKYAVNIKEGTGSAQTFATNQRTIQASMSETSIVSKVAATGLSIFKAALNSLIFFAVIEGIQLLIKGIDNLILTADEAEEKAEALRGNMQSFFDEVQSGQQTISSVSDRFSELSEHVTKTGENIDLTKDEYSEYLDICNQVKTIMPELVTGYTNEGNAIITLKDNVDSLTESYKENIRAKAAAFITNGDDDGNTIQSFFDDYKIFTEGENGLFAPSAGGLWNNKSTDYEDYYGYDKVHEWLEDVADLSLKDLQNLQKGTTQATYLYALLKENGYELANITEDNYEAVHDVLDTRLTSLEGEMATRVSNVKMSLQQMLYADRDYWDIDDKEALSAIDSMFSSIDSEFIKQNNLLGQDALQSFESNVVKLFEDKGTQKAMIDIYTPQGDDESIKDYSKRVNDAIEKVQNYAKDKKINIPLDFTDTTDNVEDLQKSYEDTINRFKDSNKIKDFFDTEGINTQKEIDAFNDVTKGINDADEAIQAYKQSVQQAQADTEELGNTLADINKTKSGIGGLFDKYEQNEGYLTQDEVASVLETNPEYIQYLVKVGDQYKLNEQALNDWNEANKEQKQEINNQMGGNDYLSNYSPLLDSIQDNASHPNGGVGNTNIGSQLDDLINKNKEWNTSLQNGEITTAQYFQNISNAITNSGLEDALHSLNGKFDDSTDYIEETVSVLATQLSDGLAQSTKRFEEGQTSVQDYIEEINAGSDAEKKLLASTYDLNISQETGKASLDGLSGSALEAAQSYNSLVDSQNALASTSGFVDVLSQNAEFLSQYTDEAGNLMDSIFDDSRFNDYISNMSNSIVDFANQNTTTMGDVASWLAETAGISTEQATSIIAQGGEAVQEAVGGSLNGVQSMTSFAMSQVGTAAGNAASAVGSVLSSLGKMISSFSYKITATPFIKGKSKFDWNPKTGLDVSLPTFGFDIKGSGGKSVQSFSTSLGKAGEALNKYGASQNASAAFNNINSYKPKKTLSANKPSSYRPTYKPKSSGKSGGGSGSAQKEPTKKDYDWIETLISRINRQVSNLGKTVSATYKKWSTRNNALAQELGSVNQQISAEQQAYNKYMQLANSVGLPEGYASLVRNGTIDVSTIADDDLNDKIEKYQNYYNKAIEASDAVQDLQDKLAELAKTRFDNVSAQFDTQIKTIEQAKGIYQSFIDQVETSGHQVSEKYYEYLISQEKNNINVLKNEFNSLSTAMGQAVADGRIQQGSEQWNDMYLSILDVQTAIEDANKSLLEYEKNLRQLKWDRFDKTEDYISKIQDESNFLVDLMSNQTLYDKDTGKDTKYATAIKGLHAVNYNAYMAQSDDYAKEIQEIDKEMAKDPYNTDLLERRQELLKAQQDAISNAEKEKQSIKSLVEEGIKAQLDALQKLIDKYKEALNSKKDLYDYQKSINEKTSNIASIQKQINAYSGDNSEETQSKIQQLQQSLKDAKSDLEDTEYQQFLSDQEQLLDTFYDETEEWLNARLDDLDGLIQQVIEETNANSANIAQTITDVTTGTNGVGYQITSAMDAIWNSNNGFAKVVSTYGDGFNVIGNNTLSSINTIKDYIAKLVKAAEEEAQRKAQEAAAKAAAARAAAQATAAKQSSSSSSSSSGSSGGGGGGNFFIYQRDSYPKNRLAINSSVVDFS